jgi:inorganic pyrophosphatase
LIGLIAAKQTEKGKTIRNDRLLAVPQTSVNKPRIRRLTELGAAQLGDIEHFFIAYNEVEGRRFKPFGRLGPAKAEELLDQAIAQYAQSEEG